MGKVITILSDSPTLPTGYKNRATQLADYLKSKGHTIHYLANGYSGATITNLQLEGGRKFEYNIYGHFGNNQYFNQTLSSHLKKTKSDILIILLDTFMLYPWFLNIDTSPSKVFFWFPTDGGGGLPKGCELILKKVNPVAMSRFGQKQVKDYHDVNANYIPHGLDSKKFYRLSDKERTELKIKNGLLDKFVIGVVARNQPRKHLDRTIKAMRLIADKIPNAILLLHMDADDPAQPMFNLKSLIQRYNLENRVIFTGMNAHNGFPDSEMNNVYNLMDCFLLTTSGEGFGIPIIEAMATEVPVIATSYTTTPELVEEVNAGYGIKLSGVETLDLFALKSQEYDRACFNGTMTGSWEVERGICDIENACERVVSLYKDKNMQKIMGLNGRKAVLEKYDFETCIGPSWEKLL